MKKQFFIALLAILLGCPAVTTLGTNNETDAIEDANRRIDLKASTKRLNSKARSMSAPQSASSQRATAAPQIEAFVEDNILTVYFNGPVDGTTTIRVKNQFEEVIHTETLKVRRAMEITIFLEDGKGKHLLEIETGDAYIYGVF